MKLLILSVCVLFIGVCSKITTGDVTHKLDPYENSKTEYQAKLTEIAYQIMSDPDLKRQWDARVARSKMRTQRDWEPPTPVFDCDTSLKSPSPPTSVHALRPSDINVIAAMGDSITSGNGLDAEYALEVILENRGESWSVGGDFDLDYEVVTIANVIKKFNPDLKGASICKSPKTFLQKAWLNVAEPGGDNRDMPHQSDEIIERCQNDPRINIDEDWKLVTLFVGGNDLCGSCDRYHLFNATAYRIRIEEALDILHNGLPRTFVNVVPMFDITPLLNLSDGTLCDLLHLGFCGCLYLFPNDMRALQLAYYEQLKELVDSGKYDTKDDFTVVLQPMFVNSTPPIDPDTGNYDQTFLSHDCFHPGIKAHQSFAYSAWNTMMIPVGQKPLVWPSDEQNPKFYCPTEENPYFFTKQNSPPAP